jgi:hypothetical protein
MENYTGIKIKTILINKSPEIELGVTLPNRGSNASIFLYLKLYFYIISHSFRLQIF